MTASPAGLGESILARCEEQEQQTNHTDKSVAAGTGHDRSQVREEISAVGKRREARECFMVIAFDSKR